MIIIGILSDSHLHEYEIKTPQYKNLLDNLKEVFNEVDHIIHAGDICSPEFLDDLQKIAPVSFCRGNCDSIERWPFKMQITVEKITIGIAHQPELLSLFDRSEINVFVHGHIHVPYIKETPDGILVICPGSLTEPRPRPEKFSFMKEEEPKPSVAFLTIDDGIVSAIIKKFDNNPFNW